jgi:methionine-rich copper-binding protein CopC
MRRCWMIVTLLGIAAASAAHGHASLERASPLAGSTVSDAPKEIVLTFSEKLEPAFSRIIVTDAGGAQVSDSKAQVDGNSMRVGLKSLAPGSYKVSWRAVSVDTHAMQGSFVFQIGGK